MSEERLLREGQILTGPLFSEPMRIETVRANGPDTWIAGLVGIAQALPTAEIALQTMLISEGIYLSDKLGREVTAEEVIAQSRSTAVAL